MGSMGFCCVPCGSVGFCCFLLCSVAFCWVPWGSVGFCCILLCSVGFCWVLWGSTASCWVPCGSIVFCGVPLGSAGSHGVPLSSTGFYEVLLGSTGFYGGGFGSAEWFWVPRWGFWGWPHCVTPFPCSDPPELPGTRKRLEPSGPSSGQPGSGTRWGAGCPRGRSVSPWGPQRFLGGFWGLLGSPWGLRWSLWSLWGQSGDPKGQLWGSMGVRGILEVSPNVPMGSAEVPRGFFRSLWVAMEFLEVGMKIPNRSYGALWGSVVSPRCPQSSRDVPMEFLSGFPISVGSGSSRVSTQRLQVTSAGGSPSPRVPHRSVCRSIAPQMPSPRGSPTPRVLPPPYLPPQVPFPSWCLSPPPAAPRSACTAHPALSASWLPLHPPVPPFAAPALSVPSLPVWPLCPRPTPLALLSPEPSDT